MLSFFTLLWHTEAGMAHVNPVFKCSLCDDFAAPTFGGVYRHIAAQHQFDPNFNVCCGLNGCPATFKKVESWRSHIFRKHKKLDLRSGTHPAVMEDNDHESEESMDTNDYSVPPDPMNSSDRSSYTDRTRVFAEFVLKLRDGYNLTQSVVNNIIQDIVALFDSHIEVLGDVMLQKLKDLHNLDEQSIRSTVTDVVKASCFSTSLERLKTEYLQNSYFNQHFGLIEPVERVLGCDLMQSALRGTQVKQECCYDVPLLDSLERVLNCENIYEQIINPHIDGYGILHDYCDGSLCQTHPLFSTDHHALQLLIYYDDVEVTNPLCSAATIHKLGLFYYTLANLHPRHRSTLDSIFLMAAVKSSYLKKYGIDAILEPFLEDVKKLESDNGVEFTIKGQKVRFRGSVALALADNPASEALGGYKALASAIRKCRQCLAVDEDIQTKFSANQFESRTKETHHHHCRLLNGPLHSHVSTTYGLVRDSSLNSLRYFHITTGLPPDVMHDILEGAVHVEIRCLLKKLILDQKLFSFHTLNERIRNFPFDDDVSDKPKGLPETFFSTGSFKLGASESWAFAKFLPLIIGDLIAEDNEYWSTFLLLLTIIDYVMGPRSSKGIACHLCQLIQQHHILFTEQYPDRKLTPKMHYMIHIPSWILQCGPPRHFWCMRFEAKHRLFKQIAKVLGNFTNIAKTLAYRHQRHMCYKLLNTKTYCRDFIETGPVKTIAVSSLSYAIDKLLNYPTVCPESTLSLVNWACIHGTKYRVGNCVILKFTGEQPLFVKIKNIVFFQGNEEPLIIAIPLVTVSFYEHYHAYEVAFKEAETIITFFLREIIDYHPLNIYQSFNSPNRLFIVLKHYVFNKDYDL